MTRRFLPFLLSFAALATACASDPRPLPFDGGFDAPTELGAALDHPSTDLPSTDLPSTDAGVADVGFDVPPRCLQSSDCTTDPAGAFCDVASGRCVACLAASDACPAAQHCDDATHTCVAGCRTDDGCAAPTADGGLPDAAVTALPYCDLAAHACVACLSDLHCPSGTVCSAHACVPGCSDALICATGRACCGGGCVDRATDPTNCGTCGRTCAYPNAAATCAAGVCAMGACTTGFADCDGDAANGCEVDTRTTLAHCGACGHVCATANGTAACTASVCAVATCDAGYGDCDGDASNGCEASVYGNQDHCGACGHACTGGTVCGYNTCAPAICCADLHGRLPSLSSGVYPLQGGSTPYTAYCDMTTHGGGWTLVLTVGSAATNELTFDAQAWTDVSVVNGDMNDPALDITRRNQGFFQVPVLSEMRFCLGTQDNCLYESLYDSSTQSVFLGPENLRTHPPTDFAVWGYTGSLGCGRAGFNVAVAGGATCRYGVLFDHGATCGGATTDTGLGFGCRAGDGTGISAGQGVGALPLRRTRGWVWVR